jgi:hypothetical protein
VPHQTPKLTAIPGFGQQRRDEKAAKSTANQTHLNQVFNDNGGLAIISGFLRFPSFVIRCLIERPIPPRVPQVLQIGITNVRSHDGLFGGKQGSGQHGHLFPLGKSAAIQSGTYIYDETAEPLQPIPRRVDGLS